MEKVRVGIIGVGGIGGYYAGKILKGECPHLTLSAVTARSLQQQEKVRQYFGEEVAVFADPIEMLDSGTIDGCIICVPHYYHALYANACLERGIHVLMEKPAGAYTKEIRQLNEHAAARPDVIFAMMYNQRTNHVYRKAKELVQNGKYGALRRSNWICTDWLRPQVYFDSSPWRATWKGEGGGVLLNQCAHQMDLWQWICGMPVSVMAKLHFGKWHNIETEDDATVYVEYPNGATGVFIASTGDGHGTNRLEIQLEQAQLVVYPNEIRVIEYSQNVNAFSKNATGIYERLSWQQIPVETDGLDPEHGGILENWAEAILEGASLIAPGQEGIHSLELINAAYLSSWEDRTVHLPLDDEAYFTQLQKRINAHESNL